MASLEQLKAKYQSVLDLGKSRGISWKNVHLENDKLLIRGAAPNDGIKNAVWDAIKAVDAQHAASSLLPGSGGDIPWPCTCRASATRRRRGRG